MRNKRRSWLLTAGILCLSVLCCMGCSKQVEEAVVIEESSDTLPEGMCLVSFQYDGNEVSRTVAEGETAEAPNWDIPEGTILEWVDENGHLVDLTVEPILTSCTLNGVLYPVVSFGEPVLKLKNGMLYPESPVSGEDMAQVITALSGEGDIQEQTMIMIPEAVSLDEEQIKTILSNIIPAYIVDSAFEGKDTIQAGPAAVGSHVDSMYPVVEESEDAVPTEEEEESSATNSATENSSATNSSTTGNSATGSSSETSEESIEMVDAPVISEGAFSRADMACLVEAIRQVYCGEEEIHFVDFSEIPMDLDLEQENMDVLLLASIPYTLGEIPEMEVAGPQEEEASAVEDSVEESSVVSSESDANSSAQTSSAEQTNSSEQTSSTADSSAADTSVNNSSSTDSLTMEEPVIIEAPAIRSALVQQLLDTKWIPGYHVVGGYLYYAQEDGSLLKNDHRGFHLYFDNNGRFTSGSKYINDLVAERLMMFIATRPAGTRDEWLRDAFDYVTHNVFYVAGNVTFLGDTCDDERWYLDAVVSGLRDWSGNCYDYAAAFTALARGLGYDAHAIAGQALMEHHEHSWVMMRQEEEGDLLCYDPQLEWRGAIMHERDNYGATMFGLKQSVCVRSWMYEYYNPEYPCAKWVLPVVDDSRFSD